MKLSSLLPTLLKAASFLSSHAILASANSVTPPAAPPSPLLSALPPSDGRPQAPLDSTFRTVTVTLPSTTATLAVLAPPSAPRPPLAGSTNHLDLRAADDVPEPAAPPAPGITAPPDAAAAVNDDGWITGIDGDGHMFRFRQTTYYSCVTQGTYSHCGWHRPILEVSGAADEGGWRMWGFGAKAAVAVGAAAGVVLVGW